MAGDGCPCNTPSSPKRVYLEREEHDLGASPWTGFKPAKSAEKGFGPYVMPRFNNLQMLVAESMCDVGERERLGLGTGWPAEKIRREVQFSRSVLTLREWRCSSNDQRISFAFWLLMDSM